MATCSGTDPADSRQKMMDLNASLLQQLECPICLDTCRPPIYMCVNGHNLCSTCNRKIAECPMCRAPGAPTIRNIAVEAISHQVLLPCPLSKAGCTTLVRLQDLDQHQRDCDYRYKCVLCEWSGDHVGLSSHVMSVHKRYYEPKSGFEGNWRMDFESSFKIYKYLLWEGQLFLCALTYLANMTTLYLQCQCVGSEEVAAKRYKAVFFLCSEDKDLSCSYCKSCLPGNGDLQSHGVVPVHKDLLEMLVQADGRLKCRFKLHKVK